MAISVDFETYSEAGYFLDSGGKIKGQGLLSVGIAAYAEHFTADIVTFSYDLGDGVIRRWNPEMPLPTDLFYAVKRKN